MAVLLLGSDTLSLEVLRFGQGEQVTWEGEISGRRGHFETIAPEYRTALDPNVTEIGVAPGGLIEFENPDFPGSIMPRRVQEEQNLAVDVVERGGSINVPNAIDIVSVQLETILAGVISPDPTGNAFERKGKKDLGYPDRPGFGGSGWGQSGPLFPAQHLVPLSYDSLPRRFSKEL